MWKELGVDEWFGEIQRGLDFRRDFGLEERWADLEAMFYNVQRNTSQNAGPNIIQSTGDALLASLNVPHPKIVIRPTWVGNVEKARVLEAVDNKLLTLMKMRREVSICGLHAFLWGRGILKIGYDSEWGWNPEFDKWGAQDLQLGTSLTQFDKKGRRIEFSSKVRPGTPWVKAVLPHDIVVPYGVKEISESPWIAHRVVRHVEDVRADRKYTKTKDLQPVMSMKDYTASYTSVMKRYRVGQDITSVQVQEERDLADFVELWEIHDRRTGKIIVLATDHDKMLRNEDDLLQLGGLPFVGLNFVPNARAFWTTPDAYYLKFHQAELTDIAIQASKNRRLGVLKFLYDEVAFDDEELAKLLTVDVGPAVRVKGGIDIEKAIKVFNPQTPNSFLYQDAESVRRSAREAVGFSRNQVGEFEQTGRRTATEAGIVQQGSELRMDFRQLAMRDLYVDSFELINSIIFKLWTRRSWAEVVGEDGAQKWEEFIGTSLKGDYQYDTQFSADNEKSRGALDAEALQYYGMFSQDPTVDPQALRSFVSNRLNNPELKGLFAQGGQNANLRLPVQGGQQGGAGVPQGRGSGQVA